MTLIRQRSTDCDVVREALSARIDGEQEPVSTKRVDAHLATCLLCRRWHADAVDASVGLSELAVAARLHWPVGDCPASRGNAWVEIARRRVFASARWGLALVGVVSVLLTALQVLEAVSLRGAPIEGHLLGESTAWSLGIGVAMIAAAIYPAAAAGLIGLLTTYSAVVAVYVVDGVADGAVTATRELAHLPALVGAVLAFAVWRGARLPDPVPGDSAQLDPGAVTDSHDVSSMLPRRHRKSEGGSAA